jgi:hypothetical protein
MKSLRILSFIGMEVNWTGISVTVEIGNELIVVRQRHRKEQGEDEDGQKRKQE